MLESAYISKRLDIRPGRVAEVAARWHRGLERMRWSSRVARVSNGFWLSTDAPDLVAGFEVRGLVWTYGRPVPLVLEFTGWSETQSGVGVSPNTLSWPVGTARYARGVAAALECMSRALPLQTEPLGVPRERALEPAGLPERLWPKFPVTAGS